VAIAIHVSSVLLVHSNMEDLYLSEPTESHHDALANALTRLQFPESFLLAYDTCLVVRVLVATYLASSGKSFLSYPLHPFRVMGIVATRAADAGMSSARTISPAMC
jgi:hypothetical protein